ncbi:MAG: CDP-alcohol phosphatidyltransferase family protein [Terriglobales bacterium]
MLFARGIPWILIALRVLLAPVILLMAGEHRQGLLMAVAIVAALLSDICDGIIARRLGVETTALRRADSVADTVFYAAAASSAWLLAPAAIRSLAGILALLLVLEVVRYAFDYAKFRREASYHSYAAKFWGLVLALALILLLAFNISGWILRTAVWVGIISDIEGLAISIVLPVWSHDIRSIAHALRARRRVLAASAGHF